MGGFLAVALLDDDEGENADGYYFDDGVGDIGAGWEQLLEVEAADEEDQGQAHEGCFEGTIHFCILTAKIRDWGRLL